jgi:hypothetical protein
MHGLSRRLLEREVVKASLSLEVRSARIDRLGSTSLGSVYRLKGSSKTVAEAHTRQDRKPVSCNGRHVGFEALPDGTPGTQRRPSNNGPLQSLSLAITPCPALTYHPPAPSGEGGGLLATP